MFEGFEGGGDRQSRKRLAASSGASLAIGLALLVGLVALPSRSRERKVRPAPISVTFRAPVKKKPPPPPAPIPTPRPKRAAAKVANRAAGPSAAPTRRPDGALPEADAAAFQGVTFGGIAWGEEATTGLGGGALSDERRTRPLSASGPAGGFRDRPVEEAERMTGPEPEPGNRPPVYPEEMRKKGIEALVILRVLIDDRGRVQNIEVVQGSEPFVGSAVETVKSYRFVPGTLDGKPAAMHRLLRVPFRLRT